jgi:hypothetical protein
VIIIEAIKDYLEEQGCKIQLASMMESKDYLIITSKSTIYLITIIEDNIHIHKNWTKPLQENQLDIPIADPKCFEKLLQHIKDE